MKEMVLSRPTVY